MPIHYPSRQGPHSRKVANNFSRALSVSPTPFFSPPYPLLDLTTVSVLQREKGAAAEVVRELHSPPSSLFVSDLVLFAAFLFFFLRSLDSALEGVFVFRLLNWIVWMGVMSEMLTAVIAVEMSREYPARGNLYKTQISNYHNPRL